MEHLVRRMPTMVLLQQSSRGEPMDFIVSGNNLNVPTAYWFATNSTVVVPELPEEPNKPVLPNTVSASVTYHKTLCLLKKQLRKPKPQVPTTPTEPTPGKPVTPTSVPVKEEAPALPATGENQQQLLQQQVQLW